MLKLIFAEDGRFPYPKSLYAVKDSIQYFIDDKPNALVVDFFAGSGTTLHAVNLLNALDHGHRRCIMVTNNEVSDAESHELEQRGIKRGSPEWDKHGIARCVTWPRTVCSIKGVDINGRPLSENYGGFVEQYIPQENSRGLYEKKRVPVYPEMADMRMSDGFKANAAFFKLGFLDKTAVALGRQFRELLPVLWLKAGAHGPCPQLTDDHVPDMMVLPENRFAVLTDDAQFEAFAAQVNAQQGIDTVYIVTDSEPGYREMITGLRAENTFQLYRDYLDNFRINHGDR